MKESNKFAFISISKEVEKNDLILLEKFLNDNNWVVEDYQLFEQ